MDPLATSAWNALLHGEKRWVVLEPTVYKALQQQEHNSANPQPQQAGVEDNDVFGWFTQLWPALQAEMGSGSLNCGKVFDFVQRPGETVYVPRGWAHAVVNLQPSVALTQNLCSRYDVTHVWAELNQHKGQLASQWRAGLLASREARYRNAGAALHGSL